jgi:hypothetical protein
MQQKIWELLGIDEHLGQYVTYPLDAKRRWETLLRVARDRDTTLHGVLKPLEKRMAQISSDRNMIVHGLLQGSLGDDGFGWTVFKGAKAGQCTPASEEFITKVSGDVRDLAQLIWSRPTIEQFLACS